MSEKYQALKKDRDQLPVFASKGEIMDAINNNSVVIIRGNTGCGKTTQVRINHVLYPLKFLINLCQISSLFIKKLIEEKSFL